jgi:hypothetical protein
MIKKYAYPWVQDWCNQNGWTDLFIERYQYWAFPPGGVMPQPIPLQVLQAIKREKGLSPIERIWYASAIGISITAIASSYWLQCPLPVVAAFGFCALVVAYLDEGDESGEFG